MKDSIPLARYSFPRARQITANFNKLFDQFNIYIDYIILLVSRKEINYNITYQQMNKQSAELFTNVDLDRIKRKYVKKPTYTGKHSNIPDTVCKEGSAKRNILRSGKGGNKHIGKSKKINKLYELDDGSDFVEVLSEHDPNYDSEEDTYGKDFQRGIIEGEGSGLSAAEIASRITALIQNYKQDIEHIINVHYLQTLEISPAELVSCHLEQCNNAYDEQLRELQAGKWFVVICISNCVPHRLLSYPIYRFIHDVFRGRIRRNEQ